MHKGTPSSTKTKLRPNLSDKTYSQYVPGIIYRDHMTNTNFTVNHFGMVVRSLAREEEKEVPGSAAAPTPSSPEPCNTAYRGIDSIPDIFSDDYVPPQFILTAIRKISKGDNVEDSGKKEKVVDPLRVTQSCNSVLRRAVMEGRNRILDLGMTIEEAKTVVSYTYNGNDEKEMSPFKEVNRILRIGDHQKIKASIDMIYMLLMSLRKIGTCKHNSLYRGVSGFLNEDGKLVEKHGVLMEPEDVYKVGGCVTYRALTSTSTLRGPAMNFAGKGTSGKRSTIFVIKNGEGYDVAPFSMFANESEIVLDIEATFKIIDIRQETWDYDSIIKEEQADVNVSVNKEPHLYDFTVVYMEQLPRDKLPMQEAIERMAKKEKLPRSEIPKISEYNDKNASSAEPSPDDEYITRSTNSGRAIKLNMRTGEIKDMASTIGLPKGWVELEEDVYGVKVKYYKKGSTKTYVRPQMDPIFY